MAGTLRFARPTPTRSCFSPCAPAAVDRDDYAGHRGRVVGGEIERGAGQVLDLEERNLARRPVGEPLAMRIALRIVPVELIVDRRLERTGREAVHRDAVFGEFAGERLGEVH